MLLRILTQFPDFEEVAGRFHESALLPYRYEKGVFALPEQQNFPVMFYRKDILEELDLEPPKTWDEVYYVISVLKNTIWISIFPLKVLLSSGLTLKTYAQCCLCHAAVSKWRRILSGKRHKKRT